VSEREIQWSVLALTPKLASLWYQEKLKLYEQIHKSCYTKLFRVTIAERLHLQIRLLRRILNHSKILTGKQPFVSVYCLHSENIDNI
jgi:hypothetical protein